MARPMPLAPPGDDAHPIFEPAGVEGRGLAHGSPPYGVAGCPYSELMKTFLTSLNASSASGPSSRPIPDCFTPPKGVQ